MSKKTCLVTGGAGFIGCSLAHLLLQDFEVVAIDNLHPQIHTDSKRPVSLDERVQLVIGDVTVEEDWDKLLETVKPSHVVHLAAETGTGQSLTEATRHAQVNVTGTTRMLDAFARHGILPERILLTSSRAVYGEGAWADAEGNRKYPGQRGKTQLENRQWDFPGMKPLPFHSRYCEPRPTSVYGATKLAQEHVLTAWCLSFGVDLVITRLQNVYGPGQSLINSYTGIVSLFARWAKEGKSIPVYEDGLIYRDFVYIDDVASALHAALVEGAVPDYPYDIGSGRATSVQELAGIIASIYDAPGPHVTGAFRHGDVRHASCSIEDTTSALGWKPKFSVEDGVATLCKWIDAQQI